MTFCTLFNVNYLDKGLALYFSLTEVSNDFVLYVLAMDDQCYEILKDLNNEKLLPIKLSDFETQELLSVKGQRKLGEYCWTCSPWIISYVLEKYSPEYCTYLDADLYFYSNPRVIIEEMEKKKASVQVVSHHFMKLVEDSTSKIVGKYCVEFNTFKNDREGKMLLDIWKKQVIEHCSIDGDGVYWGDQKYQDNWVDDYDFVIATENIGAGIAPWNLSQYRLHAITIGKNPNFVISRDGVKGDLLFYHFENIKYINESLANISLILSWGLNKKFITSLYVPYLKRIREIKRMLYNKYGIDILIKSHPGAAEEHPKEKKDLLTILNNIISYLTFKKDLLYALKYKYYLIIPKLFLKKYTIIQF